MTGDHNAISEAAAGATGGPLELTDAQKASLRETSAAFVASIEAGIEDKSSPFYARRDLLDQMRLQGDVALKLARAEAPAPTAAQLAQARFDTHWPAAGMAPGLHQVIDDRAAQLTAQGPEAIAAAVAHLKETLGPKSYQELRDAAAGADVEVTEAHLADLHTLRLLQSQSRYRSARDRAKPTN